MNVTDSVSAFASKLVNKKWFRTGIIILILISAILVGIETYSSLAGPHKALLHFIDYLIVWCFVAEILLKIVAHGRRPWDYFRDPWNVFDFVIVAVCLLPVADTHFVAVLRIARILRVLRMITYMPKLRLLIGALLKSIPSMGYVILLLSMLFYIYGVLGSFMFGAADPAHFGNLHLSLITLFKVLTLEGWTEILNVHLYTGDPGKGVPVEITSVWPLLYFFSFILFGAMIIMNLFIGVIMNSMEESQRELEQQLNDIRHDDQGAVNLLTGIEAKLDELKQEISSLKGKL
jgi:voltage-gated sodium channel